MSNVIQSANPLFSSSASSSVVYVGIVVIARLFCRLLLRSSSVCGRCCVFVCSVVVWLALFVLLVCCPPVGMGIGVGCSWCICWCCSCVGVLSSDVSEPCLKTVCIVAVVGGMVGFCWGGWWCGW